MNIGSSSDAARLKAQFAKASPLSWIAIIFGVAMPVLVAIIYPTYMHMMSNPFMEWTRLQEIPFVAAEIGIIFWAMSRGMEIGKNVLRLPIDIKCALALFVIGDFESSLFVSKVPATSLEISVSYVIHFLFGCAVYHFATGNRKEATEKLAFWLGFGLIPLCILTAWRFLLPPPASAVLGGIIEWHAALPGFISVRHFGSWTGAIAALFAALILARKEQGRLNWQDGFFFLSMGMTIWSGTRAAVLAIGFACAIQMISTRRLPSLHTFGRLSILSGLGAIAAYVLIPYHASEFMLFDTLSEYTSVKSAGSGRVEMWIAAIKRWEEAPFFGWGSGSTFWEIFVGWRHTQPHNFLVQFLISWGIVGTVGAVWLLGRAVVLAHRSTVRNNPDAWPLLNCLYALLFMASLEGMLHYPRFIILIVVTLVLMLKFGSAPNHSKA